MAAQLGALFARRVASLRVAPLGAGHAMKITTSRYILPSGRSLNGGGIQPDVWVASEPGITNAAAEYLAGLNPLAVGADTWGVDVIPAPDGDKTFYAHVTFLKNNGIYILETMNTGRLAQEDVREFLFVLGQPRMKGAVQMMVNPVAMW